jgi:hypothetical protein
MHIASYLLVIPPLVIASSLHPTVSPNEGGNRRMAQFALDSTTLLDSVRLKKIFWNTVEPLYKDIRYKNNLGLAVFVPHDSVFIPQVVLGQ